MYVLSVSPDLSNSGVFSDLVNQTSSDLVNQTTTDSANQTSSDFLNQMSYLVNQTSPDFTNQTFPDSVNQTSPDLANQTSTVVVNPTCDVTLTGESGTFQSPGYPGNYDNNLKCDIRVRVCPALVLPGNSIPGWTISRESRESREI